MICTFVFIYIDYFLYILTFYKPFGKFKHSNVKELETKKRSLSQLWRQRNRHQSAEV